MSEVLTSPTREHAQHVYDTAVAALAGVKLSIAAAHAAKVEAIAVIAKAKPSIMRAEAAVSFAKANLMEFGPIANTKGTSNGALLAAVTAFLATRPDGATNQEVFDSLLSSGVEMAGADPRANMNSYLSRWASAGSLVSKGTGKWGAVTVAAPPSFLAAPPAVVEQVAPGFLTNPDEQVVYDILGEDFPGVEALAEAGITTLASLAGSTKESLVAIPGIGAKTADKILAALAS